MCRFLVSFPILIDVRIGLTLVLNNTLDQVYKGRNDIRLSKLVTEPSHSILTQSYDSRLRLVSIII